MATLYITTNAGSGAGSLANVYAQAAEGDIIVPDPALGEHVIIAAAGAFNLTRTSDGAVTIRGLAIRLSGSNARVIVNNTTNWEDVVFTGSDRSGTESTARSLIVLTSQTGACVFRRCTFAGSRASGEVGVVSRVTVATATFLNCAFLGLSGVEDYTNYILTPASRFTAVNCSFIGCLNVADDLSGDSFVDCKIDDDDLVAGPPSNWSSSTWDKDAWRDWNPHILSSSPQARGYNSTGARYDAEGVPRVNGTLGAFETVDADLYWVGKDANGDDVTTPSMESADGWADDRWATSGGTTRPSDVASLFVGETVDLTGTWAPTNGGEITTGAGAVSIATTAPADTSRHIAAHIGAGGLSVSGAVALTNGDDLGSLTPVSPVVVDVLAPATVDSYTIPSGVTLSVVSATFSALTIDGGALKISETATVTGAFVLTAGTIELKSEGALLSTAGAVTLTAGAVTSTARAYWNLPVAASVSSIEIGNNVIRINANAGASNFLAETTGEVVNFTWSAASGQTSTLEKVSPYQMIDAAAVASNPPSTTVYAPTTFRLWSGSEWLTAVASPRLPSYLWTVEPWALALADVEDVAYNVVVWGLNPNITHSESDDAETVEETTGED